MLIKKKKIPFTQIITIGMLPSPFKKVYYKFRGYKIGKNVKFGMGSVVTGKHVEIGDNTSIGFISVVRAKSIKIGRYVKIGSFTMIDTEKIDIDDDARINEQVIIGGIKNPESYLKLGKRTIIMEYSFINPTKPIIIGDDTGIGGHCLLFTHGSWLSELDGFPVTFAPITLGKNVWLPWRVFIMPGVEIGDNVVIGANSLVTKSFPSNCLIAGSPAQIIKENYPSQPSLEKRKLIINRIFDDFVAYIKYHDFDVQKTDTNYGFKLTVKKDSKTHFLYYLEKSNDFQNEFENNSLLIIDSKVNYDHINAAMIVNLVQKTRKGSSDIGEEFLQYISRNGIRFDRID